MIYRVILLLLLCSNLYAQTFNAAPFQGIGNTGVALKSIYSITNNAAGLVDLPSTIAAIAYQANFVSTELSTQALFVGIPIHKKNSFGLAMKRYGLTNVSSLLTVSGAYVRSFDPLFSTSINLNYHSFSVKNYGKDQTFSVDLGLQCSFTDQLVIGAVFRNISKEMFEEDIDEYLASEIAVGVAYTISEDIYLSSDLYFDTSKKVNIRAGIAYDIDKKIVFRTGASNGPTQLFAGIGVHLDHIQIECSSIFHFQLGTSPQLALSYAF